MTIISIAMLQDELPTDASDSNNEITYAVNRGNSFVNTYAEAYEPFDDFTESPEEVQAPPQIGRICLDASKAFYYLGIGEVSRDGNEVSFWNAVLYGENGNGGLKQQLKDIKIEPTWQTQNIRLDSNDAMVIGSRQSSSGRFPKVIPYLANVNQGSGVYNINDDFVIRRGGNYDDEWRDAWYLEVQRGDITGGTLQYLRSYRIDSFDYAKYNNR